MSNMNVKKPRLQTQIQHLKPGSEKFFKEYVKEILESSKPYYEKADYIAYSITEISNQIEYISNEIKSLQALKKNFESSKSLALELIASTLGDYGIDKLEGVKISSITITKQSSKTKDELIILDENKVMGLGYVKFLVDEQAVLSALSCKNKKDLSMQEKRTLEELQSLVKINTSTQTIAQKAKINHKKSSNNDTSNESFKPLKQAS